jgi:hypothetical protein
MYNDKMNEPKAAAAPAAETASATGKPGKYIPPYMKDQAKGGMVGGMRGRGDDTPAIRISNLSESMVESDLEELVKKIGPHSKMYLARDKVSKKQSGRVHSSDICCFPEHRLVQRIRLRSLQIPQGRRLRHRGAERARL